jgi:hypothetical protein
LRAPTAPLASDIAGDFGEFAMSSLPIGPRTTKTGADIDGRDEVAAKFDGKHARANFWVTQQNLAKQKGGYPGYQFSERKRPKPIPAPAKAAAAPPVEAAATTPADSTTTDE